MVQHLFSQSPQPRFAKVAYDTPSRHFLFELRSATHDESFVEPWPSTTAAATRREFAGQGSRSAEGRTARHEAGRRLTAFANSSAARRFGGR